MNTTTTESLVLLTKFRIKLQEARNHRFQAKELTKLQKTLLEVVVHSQELKNSPNLKIKKVPLLTLNL